MSYDYRITPSQITISTDALAQLRWDFGLQRGIPEEIIAVLEHEFSIHAEVVDYTAEGQPEFHFELLKAKAPEREGLQGIIETLKTRLKYADSQTFELFDENGGYARYSHSGWDAY